MGMETEQEIVQLVGAEEVYFNGLTASLEECAKHKVKLSKFLHFFQEFSRYLENFIHIKIF